MNVCSSKSWLISSSFQSSFQNSNVCMRIIYSVHSKKLRACASCQLCCLLLVRVVVMVTVLFLCPVCIRVWKVQ